MTEKTTKKTNRVTKAKKMSPKIRPYTKWLRSINKIFRDMGRLTPIMRIPIYLLASNMMALESINKIIEKITEKIDEGEYDHGELPSVYIRQKDALNSCAMQLRALLVVAGLSDNDERAQPLMELLEKLAIDND